MAKEIKTKISKTASKETCSFPVIEIVQGSVKMYAFVAPSVVLRKICTVSRREEDPDKGYQRHLKESRLKQIARYLDDKNGVFPNNIILDIFSKEALYNSKSKTISFPANKKIAWIIDGQHRLFSFEYSKVQHPLLVVAFLRLNLEQEVNMFVTINTEQKRLPSSLTLDLLGIIGTEEDINTRCRDIVAKLNEDEESPWFDLVNMTGESSGYISLVNFIRKVKPLVSANGVLKSYTFQEQYHSLVNYWSAIKVVYADQWGKSLLTKTIGFGSLMNLFPTVFTKTLAMKGEFTIAAVINTFSLIKDFKFDADNLAHGTGNKAEMAAAELLNDELEQAISTTIPAGSAGVLKL